MILDATISGMNIQLLHEEQAKKKAAEKPLVQAWHKSDGAFLARLALLQDKPQSTDMKLLMDLARQFLQVMSEDIHLREKKRHMVILREERAAQIGEQLDDGIHSRFLYPGHLQSLFQDFSQAIQMHANRSKSRSLLQLLRDRNLTTIRNQIYFFLADNPEDEDYPFVFVALVPVTEGGRIVWKNLKTWMNQARNQDTQHFTLYPLHQLMADSEFLRRLVGTRLIHHPLRITEEEAFDFVSQVESFQNAGIVCILPVWMRNDRLQIRFEWSQGQGLINETSLSQYKPQMVYHGQPITKAEAEALLAGTEGLRRLNGRWLNASHSQLTRLVNQFRKAREAGTSLMSLMQLQSEERDMNDQDEALPELEISYQDWLNARYGLGQDIHAKELPPAFDPILRPYQKQAYQWLDIMRQHKLGVVLADDMGLGKTVEVLSMLERMRLEGAKRILVVVPATLVGNWMAEIRKFSPWMSVFHLEGKKEPTKDEEPAFITLVTYQKARRSEYLESVHWDAVILDEAQAIKNPSSAQTRKVKLLKADFKLALTGTPIENNLTELWSIFDFINPGLLGTKEEFSLFRAADAESLERLKSVITPFVMRRMKTDKSIIQDLPEKNEIDVTINLSREQIVLYRDQVNRLNELMRETPPAKRKFLILSAITRLKQICNHPAQFLKSGPWTISRSGKFEALRDIAQTIHDNSERVIVFTQFAQIIPALDELLHSVFKAPGATIDGSTPTTQRMQIVDDFQAGKLPYLVLSLKAAGVGLNLTEARNVIHFDRWWNPAVENQASDRAYRIGQRNDVNVYKFVAADTIEEVISRMLSGKQQLADQVINDLDSENLGGLSADALLQAIQWRGQN